ncbi:MAG: glutamine synthetase [Oscillospiraceae bacterium]|nr:glutamine synthetase [Oscillospiraceae bacterium]
MDFSPKEILNFVTENDVKFIRLTFCDMQGNLKNIAIMPNELPRAFSHGILLDAASFSDCYEDLLLVPDISTLSVLPWRPKSGRVVRFFCSILNLDGTPYAGGIRHNLQSYIREIHAKGYSCEFGTKSEFYLFDCDQEGNPTKNPHDRAGYLDVAPLDKCENTRREICLSLEEMGINPQSSAHKHGPGQNEIDFKCSEPVTAADNMVHYKTVVKTIAAQNGLFASFMPKPLSGTYGSALTIIMNVRKGGEQIFELKDGKLSESGKSFIAGILDHAPEMTAFLNPIVNSYTRLRHSGAPNEINWSFENRNPLLRIPGQVGVHPRIEVRSSDCCCNPYICFRLLLAAGIDGIERGLVLDDALCADGTEKTFPKLPATLDEAYDLAQASDFINQHLSEEIRRNVYQNIKRQLALYHAAEDKAQFEEKQYFMSE